MEADTTLSRIRAKEEKGVLGALVACILCGRELINDNPNEGEGDKLLERGE